MQVDSADGTDWNSETIIPSQMLEKQIAREADHAAKNLIQETPVTIDDINENGLVNPCFNDIGKL